MSETYPPDDASPEPAEPPSAMSGEDLLPPVEPPSAGFILQLFVVPALIVLIIVGVWLTFSWLVHQGRPEDLIQGLQGSNVSRWQRASELANMLRNERRADFKSDSSAANQLAVILDREIDAAADGHGMDKQAVMLRYFLCRALGEFHVSDGLDVLLKAASTDRDDRELSVRLGAIEAIAVLASNLQQLKPPQKLNSPELERTLSRLAEDDEDTVRSETAYLLGRLGTPFCLDELVGLVDDPHADTRYNAAVALAHQGRAEGVETLAEMLDFTETASIREESDPQAQIAKRSLIISNALLAAEELARQNPDADLSPITESLDKLINADTAELQEAMINPRRVVAAAKHTREILRQSR